MQSGIATSDEGVAEKITKGGRIIHLPFWKDLDNDDEVADADGTLTPSKMSAGEDVAVIHARGVAYETNALEELLSGSDPAGTIADKISNKWLRLQQKVLVSTLKGVFASDDLKGEVKKVDTITGASIIDMIFDSLGDSFDEVTGLVMPSYVMKELAKNDLIEYTKDSEGKIAFATYMDKLVICDDGAKIEKIGEEDSQIDYFPVYAFGKGAIAFNENPKFATTKFDEDILADTATIASRRVFVMHPRGMKWVGEYDGFFPTNAELEDGSHWKLVADRKNVKITKMLVKKA